MRFGLIFEFLMVCILQTKKNWTKWLVPRNSAPLKYVIYHIKYFLRKKSLQLENVLRKRLGTEFLTEFRENFSEMKLCRKVFWCVLSSFRVFLSTKTFSFSCYSRFKIDFIGQIDWNFIFQVVIFSNEIESAQKIISTRFSTLKNT